MQHGQRGPSRPKRLPAGQGRTLRIIGGEWRGRTIHFPAIAAIRPTPDRVRETLFNWLQNDIRGARCLDLYAGSGALGLEALSRGAARVVFVDHDPEVARYLSRTLADLHCDRAAVAHVQAARYLEGAPEAFDIVLLDPPFAEGALADVCRVVHDRGWLRPGGLAYLEARSSAGSPALPEGWKMLRSKRAGEVGYHLARREPSAAQ